MTKIIRQHFSMTGFNNTKKGVNSKCFYQFLFYFRFQHEDQVVQMTECLLGFPFLLHFKLLLQTYHSCVFFLNFDYYYANVDTTEKIILHSM